MKYPGDIIYFLMYVGPDVLMVSIALLIVVVVALLYFSRKKKKTTGGP
jgi:hypothetical protein